MKQTRPNNIRPALQRRSQEKRDRLIEVGLTVFSQRGYGQTRMADVAAEAGVSVGVLYQRFQDKRAFFEVIVETLAQRIEQKCMYFLCPALIHSGNPFNGIWDLVTYRN